MSEKLSEGSDVSNVEFCQRALREHVAPPSIGSVKARIRHASRRLRWTPNRVKDAWYADPRIRPSYDEIRDIERLTGLRHGRQERAEVDALIAHSEDLALGPHEDLLRPFIAALRAIVRALDSARVEGRSVDDESHE